MLDWFEQIVWAVDAGKLTQIDQAYQYSARLRKKPFIIKGFLYIG